MSTGRKVINSRQLGKSSDPDYFEVFTYEDDGSCEINPDVTDEEFLQHLFNPTLRPTGPSLATLN